MNFTKSAYTVALLIVGFGLAVNGYSQSFLTNALVAYYPFNGNANDASGNGYDGIVNGATLATDRFGNTNSCYSFNGTNHYIHLPLNTGNLNGSTQVTISAWMNASTTNAGCIFSHWVGAGVPPPTPIGIMFDTYFYGGTLFGALASDSDGVLASNSIPTGQWLMVTMVFDGTQFSTNRVRLFINDQMAGVTYQNAADVPSQVASLATDTLIGARITQDGLREFFSGSLDDISIYNRALSTNEVRQLFRYEAGPRLALSLVNEIGAVELSFVNLTLGVTYQLQVSADLQNWYTEGLPFTATTNTMAYPLYFGVDFWNQLFFRLQVSP